jgi:peptide deformylase
VADQERLLLGEMAELMRLAGGVGLAAPQVGINKQLLLVDIGSGPVVLFNPRIIKRKGSSVMEEGCLSLPGIYVNVRRARHITVNGSNELNENVSISASDLLARALQHEMDHLRGKLIIDYAGIVQKLKLRKKLKDLKRRVKDELF